MKYTSRSADAARQWQREVRTALLPLLKLDDLVAGRARVAPDPRVIRIEDMETYEQREIEINATPKRRIRILVTVPKNVEVPCPAVVCIAGHGGDMRKVHDKRSAYKGFAAELAAKGYVTVSTNVRRHEVYEENRTLMGERLWDLMRCVDYLVAMPDVDSKRIGCAGLSLGGEMAMWLAAMDTRIAATVSGGFLTRMDQLEQNHCLCWKFAGLRELVDFADIYALAAPRALLCQNGVKEPSSQFPPAIAQEAMTEIQVTYADTGKPHNVALLVHDGGHEIALPSLLEFFDKHLVQQIPASRSTASSGIQGGLVVHMGSGGGSLAADLLAYDNFVVHGLCRDRVDTAEARESIKQQNLYGKVSVQYWNKNYLPYTDNLVNLFVAEDLGDVPMEEVMRVLTPRGVACIKSGGTWKKTTKRWPDEIDQWTHYLHGPDNNAVAQDTRVGLPKHAQWIGYPKFARSHEQLASVSAMVSARGRLFCIIDEGLTADIRMPARWSLVARDAFNGVILWKRGIEQWSDHLHGFRSGPPDLPFRLVAVGDRVYVTLGIDQPVTALDAATGKLVMTYQGSENTRQIIHTGERLLMLAGSSQVAIHMRRGENQSARRVVMAANPETGEMLWRKEISIETLLPLVVSNDALLYQTDEHLVCLSTKSGQQRWKTSHRASLPAARNYAWQWASPTLTAHDDIVYVADFRTLSAFSIDDGKALWDCSSAAGFTSPPDIFVIDGLVWRGYTPNRGSADFGEGRNLRTGEIEKTIDTEKAWAYATLAHHRCYRPKATSRFILSSRSGIEFIDVESGKIKANHWVRGTCQYGVMPANGLLYAPPHSCACNIKTMVRGTWAFASSRHEPSGAAATDARLEKGAAYGNVTLSTTGNGHADDWPTFRHDIGRSGRTATRVPSNLSRAWKTPIGGRLSSPVASGGKLFVAEVDAHTVHALDMTDGARLWSYTAGGRIDSPPTIHDGLVLFGAADGWVYCLREGDGALVWRFRGAPEDRLIVAQGQLESAWPIHGSLLVHDGTLIVAAGRSSYVDGGIHVYRLEPLSGKTLSETVIHSLDPKTGDQPAGGVDLRGVLNDVLAVSGESVYMRHLKIDFDSGDDLATGPPHLFAPMGFLDDTWWHRSYWLFGSDPVCMPPRNESGWQAWARMGNMVPSGRILSLGENVVYGYGRDKYPGGPSGQVRGGERYHLFAAEKEAFEPLPSNRENQHLRYARSGQALGLKVTERDRRHGEPSLHRNVWSRQVPIFARALVLADETLLLAGPPERPEVRTSELLLENLDEAEAVFLGRQGAALCLVDAADGKPLAQYELECSPVFDGMIAARGRIFISLDDGSLVCYGQSR